MILSEKNPLDYPITINLKICCENFSNAALVNIPRKVERPKIKSFDNHCCMGGDKKC